MGAVFQSINQGVLTFFSFLIALVPLIIVHELGHFLMAKKLGVWAKEFGIGFPPRIMRLFNWGETEFTLNWLPLGGFVRLEGEAFLENEEETETLKTPAVLEAEEERKRHSLYAQPLRTRFWVYLAGPLMNLLVALVIATVIFASSVPYAPLLVDQVMPGSPALTAGLQSGDTLLAVDGHPLNGYPADGGADAMVAYINKHLGEALTLTIERAGQVQTITLTPRANPPEGEGPLGISLLLNFKVYVASVDADSPAAQAGVLSGDRILSIDNVTILNGQTLVDYTLQHPGETVALTVERNGTPQTFSLLVRENPPAGQGAVGIAMRHEVDQYTHYPLPQAIIKGAQYGAELMITTLMLPVYVIQGLIPLALARPTGPVGIAQMAYQTIQESIAANQLFPVLNIMLLISISLAIFNLLPIPALDGGRILFIVLEKVRGRPIPPEKEEQVHMVALMLLMGLFVVITALDIFYPVIP